MLLGTSQICDVMAIVLMVWFINLYNFMDGIDGIAVSETIRIAGGALTLSAIYDDSVNLLSTVLTAATIGFLFWNWPPAKIFMGDVGSAFLGFVLIRLSCLCG